MEEDLATKAPVTRLRRRLSVEQTEESKSPAPSTPTKKRATRAGKPQLDLIEENVAEKITPRRATRRSIARDPSEEEKPLTPSRRSTRIRSNTSLVSESQTIDSPRIKRATRRNSQVGSDNEAPSTTPARSRKARKDSTTVEKSGDTTIITEVISEEPEINNTQSKSMKTPETSRDANISPNSLRKSTRLLAKKSPSSVESKLNDSLDNKANESQIEISDKENISSASKKTKDKQRSSSSHELSIIVTSTEDKAAENNISLSTRTLIENLETKSPKVAGSLSNSIASIKTTNLTQSKRNRTKSWTTMSISPSKETSFFSDNETTKQRVRSKLNSSKVEFKNDSLNKSENRDIGTILNSSNRKKRNSLKSDKENVNSGNDSVTQKIDTVNIELIDKNMSNKISGENEEESSNIKKLFEKSPLLVQTKVIIEDSDSNAEVDQLIGDQCVPVVNHVFVNNSPNQSSNPLTKVDSTTQNINQSIEPMDIDETMPENVVLNDSDQSIDGTTKSTQNTAVSSCDENNKSIGKNKNIPNIVPVDNNVSSSNEKISTRKSYVSFNENVVNKSTNNNKSLNVSKRKSSISACEELEKTSNEKKQKSKSRLSQSIDLRNTTRKSDNSISEQESLEATNAQNDEDNKSKTLNNSQIKSSTSKTFEQNKSLNKSKEKSNITQSKLDDSIKSNNESKSTLLLSQIKDTSNTTINPKKNKSLDLTIEENVMKPNNKNLTKISTSTPLVDKAANKSKKHGAVDISDIQLKNENINTSSKSKSNNGSDLNCSEGSSDDDESSGLIIDEAADAGEDYESGDSQDEEERQYERDNEIIEKGETLTSDEDISNDSDYEKDSFIVSSDEEDNELLDGSGDDLSMSDNELSMSSKSKKKYNDKKKAEQKKASREMYNSRHKLNDSKNKSNSKVQSLLLESDGDIEKSKIKKSKRLRLDSSHETSAINSDENNSIIAKKKKAKRLSESQLEHVEDEKAMTILEDYNAENDPLSVNVKEEPKSARQSLNISTLTIDCVNDVENVHVDENVTILNSNESKDPLQATVVHDDDSDESSCNEEIMDNYSNLLSDLNKKKMGETSLNLYKKSNKKTKEPIMDELNLTVTKKTKNKVIDSAKLANKMANKSKSSVLEQDQDSSSDSIDMKLIFNEDSNDSEDVNKISDTGTDITLKKTEAETDLKKEEHNADNTLNRSVKKKKNSIGLIEDVSVDKNTSKHLDISLNTSVKSKKNKKNSLSEVIQEPSSENIEKSLNVSLVSVKKDKQNTSVVEVFTADNDKPQGEKLLNASMKKSHVSLSEDTNEKDNNMSIIASGKKKKHKKSINEENNETSQTDKIQTGKLLNLTSKNRNVSLSEDVTSEKENNTSVTANGKKKKRNKSISGENIELSQSDDEVPEETPYKSEKNNDIDTENHKTTETETSKKKRKRNRKKKTANQDENDETKKNTISANLSKKEQDNAEGKSGKYPKKRKRSTASSTGNITEEEGQTNLVTESESNIPVSKNKKQKIIEAVPVSGLPQTRNQNNKRKKREDDSYSELDKVQKSTSSNKAIPRLPTDIINQLQEKPKKVLNIAKRAKLTSTSNFEVLEQRKTKEIKNQIVETVCLNAEASEQKKLFKKNKSKFMPFQPTLATSGFGFTTEFKVSVMPKEIKFVAVAKPAEISNFKQDYLSKKLKKLTTDHMSRKPRSARLSKF